MRRIGRLDAAWGLRLRGPRADGRWGGDGGAQVAQVSSAQLATLARIAAGSPPQPDSIVVSAPAGAELTMDEYRCVDHHELPLVFHCCKDCQGPKSVG